MSRLWNILFWSVISAAFIGPGTVTTAATAGARFDLALVWALLFSTLACLLLQEAAARITVIADRDLGQAIRDRVASRARVTSRSWLAVGAVAAAVVLGCAAYEAGNILGGVAGVQLLLGVPARVVTLVCVVAAAGLLWIGSPRWVARILGLVVAGMGVTFVGTAILVRPDLGSLLRGTIVPTLPAGSVAVALGLVGTTVVPYNLFLGSSLARHQRLGDVRVGLSVAILVGGFISAAVLVVGAELEGSLDFARLADVLSERLGPWAGRSVGWGLFAAGFSSAITAPFAAAVTASSLLGSGNDPRWRPDGAWYRAVWMGVLATGLVFGLLDVRPVPIILLAQMLNGLLLPLVTVLLILLTNDVRLLGSRGVNSPWRNLAMAAVLLITLYLGASGVTRAATSALGLGAMPLAWLLTLTGGLALGAAAWLIPRMRARRADGATGELP